ncbi:hypothetical protein RB597_003510 [Gaeumannomyces tritici]
MTSHRAPHSGRRRAASGQGRSDSASRRLLGAKDRPKTEWFQAPPAVVGQGHTTQHPKLILRAPPGSNTRSHETPRHSKGLAHTLFYFLFGSTSHQWRPLLRRTLSLVVATSNPWDASRFQASDDRVRGGVSVSFLDVGPSPSDPGRTAATFHGHLNTTALGGAGFASQRTADPFSADLTGVSGLVAEIVVPTSSAASEGGAACSSPSSSPPSSSSSAACCGADGKSGKTFTVTLKNDILPPSPDGREQSTVSWEYGFCVVPEQGGGTDQAKTRRVEMPLSDFKATYRGREVKDATLDLANIKRITFMMRSFFGEQDGDFNLTMNYLAASGPVKVAAGAALPSSDVASAGEAQIPVTKERRGVLGWLYSWVR